MVAPSKSSVARFGPKLGPPLLLVLLTLAEYRLIVRALLEKRDDVAFVLANISGILAGSPVWKSSQQRVLGPYLVQALQGLTHSPVSALAAFMTSGLLAENLLLWRVFRARGTSAGVALSGVVGFGLVHFLTLYKLEYPWDTLNVLLFTAFGYWAAAQARLAWLIPLLLVGLVNHETVLYLPLWCCLAACESSLSRSRVRSESIFGGVAFAAALLGISLLRETLYASSANLPGRALERATPWLENPIHLQHNLHQFLLENWGAGRGWISIAVLIAQVTCAAALRRGRASRPAWWTLALLLGVFCVGYVNETRLYLPLIAFWFAYGGPPWLALLEQKISRMRAN